MYPTEFVVSFAKKVRDEYISEIESAINTFEEEYYRVLPPDYDINPLVKIACEVFEITEEEYYSQFKYGRLGTARQVVCFILSLYNVKSAEISRLTGFSQSRVINSVNNIKSNKTPTLLHMIDEITEKLGI